MDTLFKFLIAPLIVGLNLYVFCVVFVISTTRSCYGIKMNNRLCLSAGLCLSIVQRVSC